MAVGHPPPPSRPSALCNAPVPPHSQTSSFGVAVAWLSFFGGSNCCYLFNLPTLLRFTGPHRMLCSNYFWGDATIECGLRVEVSQVPRIQTANPAVKILPYAPLAIVTLIFLLETVSCTVLSCSLSAGALLISRVV